MSKHRRHKPTSRPIFEPIRKAVELAGSQDSLAHRLHVTQPTVSGWLRKRRAVALQHALDIETLYGIPAESIAPDEPWHQLRPKGVKA